MENDQEVLGTLTAWGNVGDTPWKEEQDCEERQVQNILESYLLSGKTINGFEFNAFKEAEKSGED